MLYAGCVPSDEIYETKREPMVSEAKPTKSRKRSNSNHPCPKRLFTIRDSNLFGAKAFKTRARAPLQHLTIIEKLSTGGTDTCWDLDCDNTRIRTAGRKRRDGLRGP
ncbi:uncharacterized protein LOC129768965 [Toxorhynchites rutilus septentrionalis]|uniref:uncharacterized protein LOC129768965 n=1 Tax=Toxorhynchites rutilus septentrionalis TaxID=329112 RepID=UPI002479D250|nr:uncharacterized protein LOC129768965 [Toxorhynchites rutilus septentrionalis]